MILYKDLNPDKAKKLKSRTLKVEQPELPQRKSWEFKNTRDKVKFIKSLEQLVRHSMEYREYMTFLKNNMDMNKCTVLKNVASGNGKKYTIEIHHEPFGLYDIVATVVNKWQQLDEKMNIFLLADEIMELHYEGIIGLIPLSKTQHENVTNGFTFIPLQYVFQDYDKFYEQYEDFMDETLKEKIETKVNLSLRCGDVQSDVLETEFVYLEVDGFEFPQIPEEWKDVLKPKIEEIDEKYSD